MKRSSFSPRRSSAARRPATSTQRKNLRLEFLEPRVVCAADCNLGSSDQAHTDVVFAPGTSAEVMATYGELPNQDGIANFVFNDTDRWNRTATNTSTLAQGDPTIIRWSVVPDGTPISGYNGEAAAPSNLRSWLAGIYGSNTTSTAAADQPWFSVLKSVFDRWSALTGVEYVYEAADDGASLGSASNGIIGRRGDVRISGHYIDGPSNILAYNFYPTVGDMVLDTGDTFFNNTANNSLRLRNTMAHEAGHGLGLDHVTPVNGTKLMEPTISLNYDGPQADDILAVNRGYGDRLEKNGGNNTAATATSLGTGSTFSFDTLSIDDDSDVDWFQFTVGAGSSVSVNLTPTGSTYTSGSAQFNALAQSNLAFAIYSGNGSTLLTTVNATAAGSAESLAGYNLPGSGTYYVKVTGSANAAQMYKLTGSISGVVSTTAPEIAVLDGATNIVDDTGSVNLGSGAIGSTISKTFTIQNTGNAPLTLGTVTVPTGFVLTQAPATSTVAAGSSTTFTVGLNTAAAGTFSGSLSFTNNDADENPFNFALSGTVNTSTPTAAPEIEILDGSTVLIDGASTVNFGSVALGATATKTFTIRNLGTSNLTLSQISLPTGFSLSAGPGRTTVAPGGSTTLTLALNTTTAGTKTGGVAIANNDANEGPFNFNVLGVVTTQTPTTAPEIEILDGTTSLVDGSSTVNFGSVTVGATATKILTIRNIGTANLNLTQLVLPTAYSLTAGPGLNILAPGTSTVISISLNTANVGTFTGAFALANNDADEGPFNLTFTGTVTATPTTPTALFNDNFNRAASNNIGNAWTERAGNYQISNQGLISTASGASVATVNVTATDVILSADVDIGTGTTTRDTGLVARQSGNGVGSQYWAGIRYSNGGYSADIYKAVNNVWTRLATTPVSSGTAAIQFEVIGSSLSFYVNGVLTTSAIDTSLTTGRIGVSSTNANTRLDNFVATRPTAPLTAAATAPSNTNTVWLAALDQLLAQWNSQHRNNS